ncbi:hypothetical protein PR048_007826 [Dryococelus australis]|uniref:Uncharacterized protein n=1 Tax=Dryococelus australis TaxID=614101 RepID=A0ABQ9HW82_9NEOP|nr:hypothetical protein PR048_007826 [Dryococelus australis]
MDPAHWSPRPDDVAHRLEVARRDVAECLDKNRVPAPFVVGDKLADCEKEVGFKFWPKYYGPYVDCSRFDPAASTCFPLIPVCLFPVPPVYRTSVECGSSSLFLIEVPPACCCRCYLLTYEELHTFRRLASALMVALPKLWTFWGSWELGL